MFDDKLLYLMHSNKSKIKKLSPFYKILSLLLFIISLIITNNIYILVLMFISSALLLYKINIDINLYIKKIFRSLIFILIVSFIYLIITFNYISCLYLFFKLLILLLYLFFIIFTTTLKEFYNGLSLLLKPLDNFNINSNKISLKITDFIYKINIFFKVKKEVKESFYLKIRGNLTIKDKLFLIKIYIKSIFINVKEKYKIKINYKIKDKNKYNIFFNIMFLLIHVIILIITICEVLV